MAQSDNNSQLAWDIYEKPGLLAITAKIAPDEKDWVLLIIKTESESADGVAFATDFMCPECGYLTQTLDKTCAISEESEMNAVTLKLKIEELPRLVAILNEVYRSITSKLMTIPEFDKYGEWEEQQWRYGDLHVVEPLFSRREPVSRVEDLKDRIAVLRAYEVISSRLSDDADKIGLLQPIG